MAQFFKMEDVLAIERLAVISALTKCHKEHDEFDDIGKLKNLLKAEDNILYDCFDKIISGYREWVKYCDWIEQNNKYGNLNESEQSDLAKLEKERDNNRESFMNLIRSKK